MAIDRKFTQYFYVCLLFLFFASIQWAEGGPVRQLVKHVAPQLAKRTGVVKRGYETSEFTLVGAFDKLAKLPENNTTLDGFNTVSWGTMEPLPQISIELNSKLGAKLRQAESLILTRDAINNRNFMESLQPTRSTAYLVEDGKSLLNAFSEQPLRRPSKVAVIQPESLAEARRLFGSENIEGWNAFSPMIAAGKAKRLRTLDEVNTFLADRKKNGEQAILFCHQNRGRVPLPGMIEAVPLNTLQQFNAVVACQTGKSIGQLRGFGTVRDIYWRHMPTVAERLIDEPKTRMTVFDLVNIANREFGHAQDAERLGLERRLQGGVSLLTAGSISIIAWPGEDKNKTKTSLVTEPPISTGSKKSKNDSLPGDHNKKRISNEK